MTGSVAFWNTLLGKDDGHNDVFYNFHGLIIA